MDGEGICESVLLKILTNYGYTTQRGAWGRTLKYNFRGGRKKDKIATENAKGVKYCGGRGVNHIEVGVYPKAEES